jgi:hypothetical protein
MSDRFAQMGSSSSAYEIPWPAFVADLLSQFRVALFDVCTFLSLEWQQ